MADKSDIQLPLGSDFISQGDNAINMNGQVLAALWDLWQSTENDVQTALRFRSNTQLPGGHMNTWIGFNLGNIYRAPSQPVVDGIEGRPPGAKPGLIFVYPVGSTASIIEWLEFGELGRKFRMTASSNPVYASGWETHRDFKRTATSLTCGRANDVRVTTDAAHAYPLSIAARAHKWRIHARNTNDRTTNTIGGSLSVSFGIGEMQRDATGQESPAYIPGTYHTVVTGAATSAGGNEYITPWVDDYPLEKMREYVIRLGFTADAGQEINYLEGGGWPITGGSANMALQSPSGAVTNRSPLDLWIELEVDSDTRVNAYFGDSLTVGQGAALPVFQSWAAKHAREQGAIPMFFAHAGARMSEWTVPEHIKFRKYSLPTYDIAKPDSLYFSMGSNDLFAESKTVPDMLAAMAVTMPPLKAVTTDKVFFTTILPRHNKADPLEVNRKAWNEYLKINLPHGGQIVYDAAAPLTLDNGSEVDPRFTESPTNIHLTNGGYARFAAAAQGGDGGHRNQFVIDETAGRVVKVWDYLNNREQLIYGDTGWREISLSEGWTGRVFIRRVGTRVSLLFNAVQSPTVTNLIAVLLTNGFRSGAPTDISERFLLHSTTSAARRGYASYNAVTISNLVANEALYGSAEMFTADPWPTSLPGVAA